MHATIRRYDGVDQNRTMELTDIGAEVDGYGADAAPLLEALSPAERLDLVSRKDSPLNTGELTLDPPPLGG